MKSEGAQEESIALISVENQVWITFDHFKTKDHEHALISTQILCKPVKTGAQREANRGYFRERQMHWGLLWILTYVREGQILIN